MADPGQDRASPAVDCVIVTFNSGASIQRCLDSLSEEGIRRFVVVDNASRDGCWEIVPQDHVIRNDRNAGFATAVNSRRKNSQMRSSCCS